MSSGGEPKKVAAENTQFFFFFALFAILAWKAASPIISPILWAALISFISAPIYRQINGVLLKKRFPGISSCLTLAAFIMICLAPALYALSGLGTEAAVLGARSSALFTEIQKYAYGGGITLPKWLPAYISDSITSFLNNSDSVKAAAADAAQWAAKFLSSFSARLIGGGSGLLMNILIALILSFFFIRDGENILTHIKSLVPLTDEESSYFFSRTGCILNSIVYGIILTVAVQALVGGIGWWFVGLSNPALFGMLMFFFGMFPVGTAVVWVPGAIYLAATGDLKNAAILFVWGCAIVGMIDNMLRPVLIRAAGGGCEIPTVLITIGLFGGVLAWGFLGIFLGPLVLALFVTACELYRGRMAKKG